jgi:hypothetical protein
MTATPTPRPPASREPTPRVARSTCDAAAASVAGSPSADADTAMSSDTCATPGSLVSVCKSAVSISAMIVLGST